MSKKNRYSNEFEILKELKQIEEINGSTRVITIEHYDAITERRGSEGLKILSDYAGVVDSDPKYTYTDGTGTWRKKVDNDKKIKASIKSIGKIDKKTGKKKRRPSEELDEISKRMAIILIDDVLEFITSGGNKIYQDWKGTNEENLMDTGTLFENLYVKVKRGKEKIVYEGRG